MTATVDTPGGGSAPGDEPNKKQRGKRDSQGAMSLPEHLRELRSRILKSALAVVIGSVIGWVYYQPIFAFISKPMEDVVRQAQSEGRNVQLTITDVAGAFTLQIQVALITGIIIASPVWIYQLWRFITPGLHKHERRYAIAFAVIAVPLFLSGVVMSYLVMPGALRLLFGFTPQTVANFPQVDTYLSFFTRMLIVFGVGFLTPLLLISLNVFGVLTGKKLASWWRFIIFGVFLFGAIATPTGDPINLCLLSLPILVLVGAALVFCFLNDKRRARKNPEADYSQWADDETSPL